MIYRPFTYKGMQAVIFADSEYVMWFGAYGGKSYGTYSEKKGDEEEKADVMEQFAKESIDKVETL